MKSLRAYLSVGMILLCITACSTPIDKCGSVEVPAFTGNCYTDLHKLLTNYVAVKESALCK